MSLLLLLITNLRSDNIFYFFHLMYEINHVITIARDALSTIAQICSLYNALHRQPVKNKICARPIIWIPKTGSI